jgi:NADH:ubiquinone reductase (H+-translocating)
MTENGSKRILILGGGFAGLDAAQQLEKIFSEDEEVEITLVNQNNYLVFTSMLAEVVASSIDAKHVVIPIRECLKRASFKELEIQNIDLEKKTVTGFHHHSSEVFEISYDYLIIALGSMTGYHGVPGAEEYSFPLKSLSDAMILRNHVIDMFEYADLESDPELRRKLLTFVVVGGGYTGIEVAAELNDFVESSQRFYKSIRPDEVKVWVVDPGTRIMHEMSEGLADYGLNLLRKRGMEFLLQTRVKAVTPDRVEFQDGNFVETKTPIWAAGTAPQPAIRELPCANERGRVEVNEYMEVPNLPGVWALGDCAQIPDPRTGKPYPPTAQHATREGKRVAFNVAAAIKGKNKKPFKYKAMGMLAPLGRRSAVAEILGIKFSGFIAWFMWRSIYLAKIPGWDRKFRVAIDWFFDMFLPRDLVQLKFLVRPKQSTPSEK